MRERESEELRKNEQIKEKPQRNRAAYKRDHHTGEQEHSVPIYDTIKNRQPKASRKYVY